MRGSSRQARRRLNLWSKRGFAELDGRLAEAYEERRIIADLSRHVGQPTIPQKILIKRSARLLVMLSVLERRMIELAELGDLGSRQMVALHNALRLSLQAIGLERAEEEIPSVANFLKARPERAA